MIAKEEWELSRLQALRDEEERRAELEEDEMLYTYSRDHAGSSQVKKRNSQKDILEGYVYLNASALDIATKGQKGVGRPKKGSRNSIEGADVDLFLEQAKKAAEAKTKPQEKRGRGRKRGRVNNNIEYKELTSSESESDQQDDEDEEVQVNGDSTPSRPDTPVTPIQPVAKPKKPARKSLPKAKKPSPPIVKKPKPSTVGIPPEMLLDEDSPPPPPQPWSNPNLVIRTRRASAKEGSSGEEGLPSPPNRHPQPNVSRKLLQDLATRIQQRPAKPPTPTQEEEEVDVESVAPVKPSRPQQPTSGPVPILSKFMLPQQHPVSTAPAPVATPPRARLPQNAISLSQLANLNPALRNALAKIAKPGQLINLTTSPSQPQHIVVSSATASRPQAQSSQPQQPKTTPTKNPVPILEKMAAALQQQKAQISAQKPAQNPSQLLKNVMAARAVSSNISAASSSAGSSTQQQPQQQKSSGAVVNVQGGQSPLQLIPQQIIRVPGSSHHFIQLKAASPQQLLQLQRLPATQATPKHTQVVTTRTIIQHASGSGHQVIAPGTAVRQLVRPVSVSSGQILASSSGPVIVQTSSTSGSPVQFVQTSGASGGNVQFVQTSGTSGGNVQLVQQVVRPQRPQQVVRQGQVLVTRPANTVVRPVLRAAGATQVRPRVAGAVSSVARQPTIIRTSQPSILLAKQGTQQIIRPGQAQVVRTVVTQQKPQQQQQ